ncbi:MAG: hypothetical protein A2Z42_02960 [Candidatus Woykebacteria bacterium RBG_19FT_COMBO_43_10]|uniref:Uncharacterized protein n=1 Tax=Candidatus Woykebacteria bacterium RBG_19FT_COMBO_43_10 TaxID=1802598 RepID=A0A1G1WKB4_9BACT|nr:MAG: hypothetical protein A2Z42_02960 [Candidatus Woykebacteria bacterium RBG_19FT_COMBO_43_10]
MTTKALLLILFIQGYINEAEAEYLLERLKGRLIPEKIADMAYQIDELVGEYRQSKPVKPKFSWNPFVWLRSLNVSSQGTSRQDIEE